jgi:hypothetical protein
MKGRSRVHEADTEIWENAPKHQKLSHTHTQERSEEIKTSGVINSGK